LRFENKNVLFCIEKNAIADYNAGVVAVNSEIVGLAPAYHRWTEILCRWVGSFSQFDSSPLL
jgi:hypothetical protein